MLRNAGLVGYTLYEAALLHYGERSRVYSFGEVFAATDHNAIQCDSMRFNAYLSCQGATHAVVDATCEADSVVVQSSASASAHSSTCYAVPTQATVRCGMLAARAGHG